MRKIFLAFILFFLSINNINAYNKTELNLVYNKLYLNFEKKNKNIEDLIKALENLDSKVSFSIQKTNSKDKKIVLYDLKALSRQRPMLHLPSL